MLATERVIAGLRLVRPVGSGGEGEVWEARDRAGRPRALKLVRPKALASPADVWERGEQLRRIEHPALVRVHRSGILEQGRLVGWGFVEMDFVAGTPLDDAPADPDLARLWPLAEALDLLHSGEWSDGAPLVHRDVKPANLIETPDGQVVLVDPSTLRGADASTMTRVGTPVFCAPEVFRGRSGPAADVYSFAATVVALSTGQRGAALADLLAQAQDDPEGLGLPEGVRQALSHRIRERPRSCCAVLDEAATMVVRVPTRTLLLEDLGDGLGDGFGDGPGDDEDSWDETDEADESDEPVGATRAWPFLVALALLAGTPLAVWASGAHAETVAAAGALAAAGHVGTLVAGRGPLWRGLLVPPLGWAALLAERSARPHWAGPALAGALAAGTAATVYAVLRSGPRTAALALAAALGLSVVVLAAAKPRGVPGWLARALLLPLWLVGAVLVGGMMRPANIEEEA